MHGRPLLIVHRLRSDQNVTSIGLIRTWIFFFLNDGPNFPNGSGRVVLHTSQVLKLQYFEYSDPTVCMSFPLATTCMTAYLKFVLFFLRRRIAVVKGLTLTFKSDFHSCVILHLPAFRYSAVRVLKQVNANPPPNPLSGYDFLPQLSP